MYQRGRVLLKHFGEGQAIEKQIFTSKQLIILPLFKSYQQKIADVRGGQGPCWPPCLRHCQIEICLIMFLHCCLLELNLHIAIPLDMKIIGLKEKGSRMWQGRVGMLQVTADMMQISGRKKIRATRRDKKGAICMKGEYKKRMKDIPIQLDILQNNK